jgi:hypothetical protein
MKTEINQSKAEIRKAAISKTEILKVESRNQPSQKAEN